MKRFAVLCGIAIFLESCLLFLVEPMAAKRLLPLLGGAAAVWTTCLVFFQCVLLLGYLCAHWLVTWFKPRVQGTIYILLLAASVLQTSLNIQPELRASTLHPVVSALWLLTRLIGLPFLVLAATNPLLQAWYASGSSGVISSGTMGTPARPPYRLYALSNFGSLLALLLYPIFLEPRFSLHQQTLAWFFGFLFFALACAAVGWMARKSLPERAETTETTAESAASPPSAAQRILWLLLAMCGSLLLSASTNYLSQDVVAIPLLWILPLTMYLLSFVLAFNREAFYPRIVVLPLLAVALICTGYYIYQDRISVTNEDIPSIKVLVPLFCSTLFIACLFCHGELYRRRPAPHYATSFYLLIAAGGALGAIFVGVVAPLIFRADYELACGFCLTAVLALLVTWNKDSVKPLLVTAAALAVLAVLVVRRVQSWSSLAHSVRHDSRLQLVALSFAVTIVLGLIFIWMKGFLGPLVWTAAAIAAMALVVRQMQSWDSKVELRSFYGVLRVVESLSPPPDPELSRTLYHGTIEHGNQTFSSEMRMTPTTYYAHNSGVGLALDYCCGRSARRVGAIGLGIGTVAAYGRKGDVFRFYDIDPLVERIARNLFTYLRETSATTEVVLGDARVSMAGESPQRYDVLVVDAFSGDAIPVHLLTTEAVKLYRRHLQPDGIIAFHISSHYLDLGPVVQQQAEHAGLKALLISSPDDEDTGAFSADWVLVTANEKFLSRPEVADKGQAIKPNSRLRLWTDDYSSLLPLIKYDLPPAENQH